jgi:hypothetical protein
MKRRTLTHPDVYRQSLLNGFTTCARRTKFGLLAGEEHTLGWVGHTGDLGTALHAVAREILRTLYRQGEPQMPTQEAVEVMYEVVKGLPFALPAEALDDLRWLTLAFAGYRWNPKRILALEEEIRVPIECPDGVTRTLKGQPDILVADPPSGLIVVDLKSGRGRPKGPRVEPEQGEVVEGREYLAGTFQGDVYALLGLHTYPAANRVIFRELHLRSGQIRQMTLGRDELEHVERKVAVMMMQLDRAITEGPRSELWAPRPGGHCTRRCPVSRSCPVPREMRGEGGIATKPQADQAARALAVLEGQRAALISQLKAFAKDPGNPLPMANDHEFAGWNPPLGRGRKFGLWDVKDIKAPEEAAT